jgi:hypothetical protein
MNWSKLTPSDQDTSPLLYVDSTLSHSSLSASHRGMYDHESRDVLPTKRLGAVKGRVATTYNSMTWLCTVCQYAMPGQGLHVQRQMTGCGNQSGLPGPWCGVLTPLRRRFSAACFVRITGLLAAPPELTKRAASWGGLRRKSSPARRLAERRCRLSNHHHDLIIMIIIMIMIMIMII